MMVKMVNDSYPSAADGDGSEDYFDDDGDDDDDDRDDSDEEDDDDGAFNALIPQWLDSQ